MSEIPKDIWDAAYVVFNGERPITPAAIARALMAERGRMMAAVDDVCDGHGSDHDKIRFIRARIRNA